MAHGKHGWMAVDLILFPCGGSLRVVVRVQDDPQGELADSPGHLLVRSTEPHKHWTLEQPRSKAWGTEEQGLTPHPSPLILACMFLTSQHRIWKVMC